MARLIDADALADEVACSQHNNPHTDGKVKMNHHNEHNHFLKMIFDAPTVEAVPVVHGRWIDEDDGDWRCSACRSLFTFDDYGDMHPRDDYGCYYCHTCGAKMDGGAEDG